LTGAVIEVFSRSFFDESSAASRCLTVAAAFATCASAP
jgi:hypothetical protein